MSLLKQKGAKTSRRHYFIPATTGPSVGSEIELHDFGACPFWGSTTDMFLTRRQAHNVFKFDFVVQFEKKMVAHKHTFTTGMLQLKMISFIDMPLYPA
jgi:hypothetical protein